MDMKLGGTKLKLAEAESLNLAQANEIADLKAVLEAYENKWYNAGFTDIENFVEPIVHQFAALQNPIGVEEEEDTPSIKELVQEIDFHMELVDLEITRNLNAVLCIAPSPSLDPTAQPTVDAPS
ncbi:hypothetical protein SO802_012744 [Lithocarpus litseifolius]|uniref:Uncharacterized protein n=1 Tax=Lithocarpus litseifolius TaxID=425828 RepID=A0AAW2D672_9ROSI